VQTSSSEFSGKKQSEQAIQKFNDLNLDSRPIFIAGYPRSGTTLIQSLLATQPEVVSFPETHFFDFCAKDIPSDIVLSVRTIEQILRKVQEKMCFQIKPEALSAFLDSAMDGKIFKKNVFDFVVCQSILEFSAGKIMGQKPLRWIEKTPSHAKRLNEISALYPNAKFVVMIRKPEQAIFSRKIKIPDDRNRSIKSLAKSWANLYGGIFNYSEDLQEKIKILHLEDLQYDMQGTLVALCGFLDMKCNVEKFKDFGKEAKGVISQGESWKTDVEKGSLSQGDDYKIGLVDRFIIKKYTKDVSSKYKY